ncbi:hypothetical protein FDP22_14375 [Paroceanicella profunda]|uniref:PD-(D/E)XK nuclease family protein n=1 Tax=Paroceanicella profunda TaxID=2579971 RepID=A0A5B8FYX1_9RHOB|nr:hypothetical protein [Paroceanicella profunda]QDL92864.1 hypothetical protein FDP22_14375 [Paroceanicella profunda]
MSGLSVNLPDRVPFNVQERDIDLLLLEQIHVSPPFLASLTSKLGLAGAEFDTAAHSVSTELGETDVLLVVHTRSGLHAVMIEDKIGAPMQGRQAERYHQRGAALCAAGRVTGYTTVLCAPRFYLSGVGRGEPWQHKIPLEEMCDWLGHGPAADWRRAILGAACAKLTRARSAERRDGLVPGPELLALKRSYHAYVSQHHPNLLLSTQVRGERDYFISAPGLPKGIRFKHGLYSGWVSLICERKWRPQAEAWLARPGRREDLAVERFSGEIHLRLPVEILDPALPAEVQAATINAALDRIGQLRRVAEEIAEIRF